MSEEQAAPVEKKPMPSWLRQLILACVAVLIIMLVFWSATLRMEGVRRKELSRGVDAVSSLLTASILERKPDKMRQTLQTLAAAGGYEKVTVTDQTGAVLASTDRTVDGKTIAELSGAPTPAKLRLDQGRYVIVRAINLGEGNAIGGLEVVVAP
ncbi:MAG: hypothetical protein JSS65_10645 [Armatimonadetes bacterium]|nr:hypothetical protein [Armatimonadota bacterium]